MFSRLGALAVNFADTLFGAFWGTRTRRILTVLLPLLLGLLAQVAWRIRNPAAGDAVDLGIASAATTAGAVSSPRESHSSSNAPTPRGSTAPIASSKETASLPPKDMSIARAYDELAARARAGDVRARCRLAEDLERCASLPFWRAQGDFDEAPFITDMRKQGATEERIQELIDNG